MGSDYKEPLNVGSDEMVSMNDMAAMAMTIAGAHGKKGVLPINHIPGPEGVRGRNSNAIPKPETGTPAGPRTSAPPRTSGPTRGRRRGKKRKKKTQGSERR